MPILVRLFIILHMFNISEKAVDEISVISSEALENFVKLKHRKINVENLLNTMTASLEMKRI